MSIPIEGFSPENLERIYLGEVALVGRGERSPIDVLGDKEYEVAELAVEGLSYEEIAAERQRALATIRTQLRSAYVRLGVTSKAGLVAYFPISPDDPQLHGKILEQLPQRSLDALEGLSRGKAQKTVAREMGITTSTVRTHVLNVSKGWTGCRNATVTTRVANGVRAKYLREVMAKGDSISERLEDFALPSLVLYEAGIRERFRLG